MSKVIWQKAASPTCHPSQLRIDLSDLVPNLCIVPLIHKSLLLKRYICWFSPFLHCALCTVCNQHTDKHTDLATCDICRSRLHLRYACDVA